MLVGRLSGEQHFLPVLGGTRWAGYRVAVQYNFTLAKLARQTCLAKVRAETCPCNRERLRAYSGYPRGQRVSTSCNQEPTGEPMADDGGGGLPH